MLEDVVQRVLRCRILLENGLPHKPVNIHLFLSAGEKPFDFTAQFLYASLSES